MKQIDLMEVVNAGTPVVSVSDDSIEGAFGAAERLERLGFKSASAVALKETALREKLKKAEGFTRITPDNVRDFLKRVTGRETVLESVKQQGSKAITHKGKAYLVPDFDPRYKTYSATVTNDRGYGTRWLFQQIPLEEYNQIPPKHVLDRLEEVKNLNIFDFFVVAKVDRKEVKDPLLLGKFNDHDDMFFIAQWGDDVTLDDLI